MNFYDYIKMPQAEFEEKYINTRLVMRNEHPTFPLYIYAYGREAVHEQVWDYVTMRCRGIIVHKETGEIIARPFEKFFNYGTANMPETDPTDWTVFGLSDRWKVNEPTVWEKVDGFLCTGYKWDGRWYVASKGSFTSPHAKWATNWLQGHGWLNMYLPDSKTPVFEGICSSLRIVVDYGAREEMVLLALIDNETGEEMPPEQLKLWAECVNVSVARQHDITMQEAHQNTYDESVKNKEGYVLTWYRTGQPPFRLKLKFADYLRLHRLVTGVSPKHILEVLRNGWTTELDEYFNASTPWFSHFVTKWKRTIEGEYERIDNHSKIIYAGVLETVQNSPVYKNLGDIRKEFAYHFTKPENVEFSGVLFAMLDGKDYKQVIWKKVKNAPFMKGGHTLVDAHTI
jgi:RNA ligase